MCFNLQLRLKTISLSSLNSSQSPRRPNWKPEMSVIATFEILAAGQVVSAPKRFIYPQACRRKSQVKPGQQLSGREENIILPTAIYALGRSLKQDTQPSPPGTPPRVLRPLAQRNKHKKLEGNKKTNCIHLPTPNRDKQTMACLSGFQTARVGILGVYFVPRLLFTFL